MPELPPRASLSFCIELSLITILIFIASSSTQGWLGTVGCAVRSCSLTRGPGRRSYPFLSSCHHLLMSPPPLFHICCCFPILFFQTAGVRGTITRYVMTVPTPSTTYHFYELDVATVDQDWLERKERRREWVDYAEAVRRVEWKSELAQGLRASSLAPARSR
jgi:hypothetical protein